MTEGYLKCNDCGVFFHKDQDMRYIEVKRQYNIIGEPGWPRHYCGMCAPKHFKE